MGPEANRRILIIDDEAVIRQAIERALSRDYEVISLASSEALEETLQQILPDLLILDVRMPEEDGMRLCSRLRRDRRFDAVPIIFLSGLADEATVRKGFASGGDYYLPKPFDLMELSQVVKAFIGRKHRHPDDPVPLSEPSIRS
jgi:DNA-binding response OmpR family regulator